MAGGRKHIAARPVSLDEAATLLGDPVRAESRSPFGVPVLGVELAGARALPESFAALSQLSCVTVAVGADPAGIAEPFDCHVATAAELDAIAAAVMSSPLASLALVQRLRVGEGEGIEAGIVSESFVYSMLQAGSEFAAWRKARGASRGRGSKAPLRVVRVESLLSLTLDRAEKRNAFSAALRDALYEVLSMASLDATIERIELRGKGPDFCSGGDLDEFGTFSDVATAHAIRTTRSPARLFARCADRLYVDVHGACVGAGIELPAFAKRIVAAPDATFRLPEISMGLIPGAGGTVSLPPRIGRQRTAWLALTGSSIDARTALEWGLVDDIAT